jgi:hypothetical protein
MMMPRLAYWQLAEGRYVYWRATITSAESLDEPFRRDRS